MSQAARTWAYGLKIKPASAKFVLVTMADTVDSHWLCFLPISRLGQLTDLDRKTVISSLQRLKELQLIMDTGNKAGRTKSIAVYQLRPSSRTGIGTTKQSQNRDGLGQEAVPLFPPSCTDFPSKQSQKRDTEHKETERNITKAGKFVPPTVEQVRAYCDERKSKIDPEHFVDYYTSNGWMRGKTNIKDWKACVRIWDRNQSTSNQQAQAASINSEVAI